MTEEAAQAPTTRRDAEEQEWQTSLDPLDGHNDESDAGSAEAAAFADAGEEAVRPWRVAKSRKRLLAQVNAAYPNRAKGWDGTIGDAAHQSRASDHNPWVVDGATGVVTAMDITHDPAHGCDGNQLSAALRASADARIKYIIWNKRICNASAIGSVPAWTWRTYTGKNPHDHHVHLSVKSDKARYDNEADWSFRSAEEAVAEMPDDEADARAALAALGIAPSDTTPLLEQIVDLQDALGQISAYALRQPLAVSTEEAAFTYDQLKANYEALFASAKVASARKGEVAWYLKRLRTGRPRYEEVAAKTKVPWWFVGIVHAMEAGFSFSGHLHNGDPLTARTVQIPKDRPPKWNPPSDWLSSAYDALEMKGYVGKTDWEVPRALYRFESYNGYGYYSKNINSPYLWSFSNHYTKGKYVRDGVFDPNAVSKQCGAAVMLRALLDSGDITI